MSELIDNREHRQKVLKELIMELHQGKTVDEVRQRFEELIKGVSVSEISQMEQALIREGLPVEEVQRLCDVHAAVFKGSIEDIHKPTEAHEMPGHPVHTMMLENRAVERLIENSIRPRLEALKKDGSAENRRALKEELGRLLELDKHYSRKENLLFPYLEKYEITGPPKVMWGVDDEIRADIKGVLARLVSEEDSEKLAAAAESMLTKVTEMIFKEENILIPMALEILTEDEWLRIAEQSDEIGYTLVRPAGKWKPARVDVNKIVPEQPRVDAGTVQFDSGTLTVRELEAMLNTMPIDITFIDKNDVVKYFDQGKDRIFHRPKAVLGRTVQNCHPPASVHVVEKMLNDFKSGRKDHEDFWIQKGDLFVYIRYFAVRDENGEYLGTMEVTQNIRQIQELKGEKRLAD